jgi:hypothetical protein
LEIFVDGLPYDSLQILFDALNPSGHGSSGDSA